MKHLEKLTRKKLGDVLVDEGLISKNQLADAEREQKRSGEPLGAILVDSSYISDFDLAKTVAAQYQLPFVHLGVVSRSKDAEALFPKEQMRRQQFVPLDKMGGVVTLAVAEMPDLDFLADVKERMNVVPFLFVALLSEIRTMLESGSVARPGAAEEAPAKGKPAAAKAGGKPAPKPESADLADLVKGIDPGEVEAAFGEGEEEEDDDAMAGWESIFDAANAAILREKKPE